MSALWEEFERCRDAWHAEGDAERLRLIERYHQGMSYRETRPELQFQIVTRCRDEAERLNEPWWVLFFEYWRLDAIAAGKHDFARALPLAVELMTRFSSPQGRAHPYYNQVLTEILYVYAEVDPFAYRDELERGFDVLEARLGATVDSGRFVLDYRKASYLFDTRRVDEAHDCAGQNLDLANLHENTWHATWALFLLCRICHSLGRWDELAAHAESMAEQSRGSPDRRRTLADAWLWLALVERARGDGTRAARSFQTGMRHLEGLDRRNEISAEPIAAYYEQMGDWKAAAGVRARQINELTRSGALHRAALAHIERCRVLKAGGELSEADLRHAREAAERMRQPSWYLEKLGQVGSPEGTGSTE